MVLHVDKYKITFKLVVSHRTNEMSFSKHSRILFSSVYFRPARPRTQHGCHHDTKVKPEAATAVIELLMRGGKTPETYWSVNKRQDNKLKNCCMWLVIYLNWNPLNSTLVKTSYFWYRPVSHNAIFSTPCPLTPILLGPYYLLNTLFWISKKKWRGKYEQRLMR